MSAFVKCARNMPLPRWFLTTAMILLLVFASVPAALGQAGFEDDRVMLGVNWESYRHGHPGKVSDVRQQTLVCDCPTRGAHNRGGRWTSSGCRRPPMRDEISAGYDPREYFRLDNSYGTFNEHRAALRALLQNGVEPVADIVINHREWKHRLGRFQKS